MGTSPRNLTVKINNHYRSDTMPKAASNWYPYGGLYRSVYTEEVSRVYPDTEKIRDAGKLQKVSSPPYSKKLNQLLELKTSVS